jgi:hypothetical protein
MSPHPHQEPPNKAYVLLNFKFKYNLSMRYSTVIKGSIVKESRNTAMLAQPPKGRTK